LHESYIANGGLAAIDDTTATEDDFIDLGEAGAFEVVSGEGECSA
jgi:hypothetical protein